MTRHVIIADTEAEVDALPWDAVYRAHLILVVDPNGGYRVTRTKRVTRLAPDHVDTVRDAMACEFDLSDL